MAYATTADVRAVSKEDAVGDENQVPDSDITAGISYAETVIDQYCGTSFEFRTFSVTIDGNGASSIRLVSDEGRTVMYPQTLTSATIDGTAVDAGELATWKLHRHGVIARVEGLFPAAVGGRNVVVVGTAGMTSAPPVDIAQAASLIARQFALDAFNRANRRALTITDELGGQALLAQPGKHGPTGIPEVNQILKNRRRRRPGMA